MTRKLARRFAWLMVAGALVIVVAALATARGGDAALYPSPPGGPKIEVFIVSNGYHSGIAVPREALRELAEQRGLAALTFVATRFAAYAWLEIGYGEEAFYRSVPTLASIDLAVALQGAVSPGQCGGAARRRPGRRLHPRPSPRPASFAWS